MELERLKNKIKDKSTKVLAFLRKRSKWILIFICLFFMGYCAYLWYFSVYNSKWSESKKQEYISTKEREVVFGKDKFDSMVSSIRIRKADYQKNIENVPDIFRLK